MTKTATPGRCLSCGTPLSGEARQGICPKCLYLQARAGMFAEKAERGRQNAEGQEAAGRGEQAGESDQSSVISDRLGDSFGDYELLEVIGRGGMGMVYRARQRSLDRVVAIKMMAFGPGSSPEMVKRFRAEALAAAALQHPNIVAIHEVGMYEGRHFFVMDYVEGQSLAQLAGSQPVPARRAAEYLKTIAEAVHYAHERGILHRDLKPSNVLVDGQDQPRIVDFGLARRLEGGSELTVTGQVLGSPHYLPPEQATARRGRVSRRTDVYGLGATLYHLLTGRPPFQAESLTQTLDLALHTEPIAPRLLNPGLPRDLETICLKCLEKEPAKRYPTAQAMAEELGRFLQGQPILARPLGPAGKAWRWCRRNPRLAAAVGAAALILVVGLATTSWQWRRADVQRHRAEAGELSARRNAYAADMKEVQRSLEENDVGRAIELLNRHRPGGKAESRKQEAETDLRSWEWRYLRGRCQTDERFTLCRYSNAVSALAFSADGKLLAMRTGGSSVGLWDARAKRPLAELWAGGGGSCMKALAFSPQDSLLAWGSEDASGQPVLSLKDLKGRSDIVQLRHSAAVRSVAFSPDGKVLATLAEDGWAVIWDTGSHQVVKRLATATRGHTDWITGGSSPAIRQTGSEVGGPSGPAAQERPARFTTASMRWEHCGCVLFSPDGRWLAVGEVEARIRLFDRTTGQEADPILVPQPANGIICLAFSPDSKCLAASCGYSDHDIHLWDVARRTELRLSGHTAWVAALAFSPDGQTLASASADQTLRLWDLARKTARTFQANPDEVWALAWSPEGKDLVTGAKDGYVRYFDPAVSPAVVYRRLPEPVHFWGPTFLPDSKSFLTVGRLEGEVVRWDTASLQPLEKMPEMGKNHTSIELSRDGRWLALGDAAGNVQVWDFRAHAPVTNLTFPMAMIFAPIFSPQATVLGAGAMRPSGEGVAKLWAVPGWRELNLEGITLQGIVHADFSPDDRILALGYTNGQAIWWDIATCKSQGRFDCRYTSGAQVAFSPNGRLFATGGFDGRLTVWDTATRAARPIGRGYRNGLHQLVFSPDSRRVVASGTTPTGVVKVWDVETGRDVATLPGEPGWFSRIGFSPDGNTLFAASQEGVALFWHAPSLAEIAQVEKKRAGAQ